MFQSLFNKIHHCQYHFFTQLAADSATNGYNKWNLLLNTAVFLYGNARILGTPFCTVSGGSGEWLLQHDYLYTTYLQYREQFDLFVFVIFWCFALLTYAAQLQMGALPVKRKTCFTAMHQMIVQHQDHFLQCRLEEGEQREALQMEALNVERSLAEKN